MNSQEILDRSNGGLDVFQFYVGHLDAHGPLRFNKHYKSPLGHDGRASFDIYPHETLGDARICFKDHGIGIKGGDCFAFVQRLFNCEFSQALDLICEDVLGLLPGERKQQMTRPRPEKVIYTPLPKLTDVPAITIQPQMRAWRKADQAFFARSRTSLDIVEAYYGRAIEHYDLRKPEKSTRIHEAMHDPIYGYYFANTAHWKMYRPYSERFKWIGNTDGKKDIFGLHLLPDACEVIILAAGNRDTMALHELTKLPILALASESAKLTPEVALLLSSIARRGVYSFMDTDAAGIRAQDEMLSNFGVRPVNDILKTMHPSFRSHGYYFNDVSQAIEESDKTGNDYAVCQLRDHLLALTA